ncbi:TadE/TadG family type IV pilus assembly protein [uncultured Methylobacterium sp.]|uniref:TadE/TadG family type IV pilus assembly protein n=1 Tax=uncultured Methylobacterium sp. TaxID=157278 RepID=UPI0035CB9F26
MKLALASRANAVRRIRRAEGGNVIILFALGLPVMLGVAGTAIDYGNATRIRAIEQSISDATTLLVASGDTLDERSKALTMAEAQLRSQLGSQVEVLPIQPPVWSGSDVKLTISTKMKTALVHLLPGMPREMQIDVVTKVNRVAAQYETESPKVVQLTPSAADFNVIYSYCYSSKASRQNDADKGRRGFVAIADNAAIGTPQTDYSRNAPTKCEDNEAQSYMLKNVWNGNSDPSKRTNRNEPNYEYFADNTIDQGTGVIATRVTGSQVLASNSRIAVDTVKYQMLETIVCDTLNECKSKQYGGILPNSNTKHSPSIAKNSCSEGKYLYYGWEDRNAGADQDYDDIRLVVSCPKQVKVADKQLRIVE